MRSADQRLPEFHHFPYSLDMIARSIDGTPESLTPNDVLDTSQPMTAISSTAAVFKFLKLGSSLHVH